MSFTSPLARAVHGATLLATLGLPAWAQPTPTAAAAASLPEVIVQERAQEIGYQPRRATTATRTDAAIRDVPQAINVVPAQALQDQAVRNIDEALYNVSGVTQANTLGGTQDALIKRGFGYNRDGSILRDGVRTVLARNLTFTTERVEVIKGPSSILYGAIDPGGIVNMVTKKPQLERAGQVVLTGSNLGGGASLDLTGPIGTSGLAYRLIGDFSKTDYWRNFGENRQTVIAPSLAWYGRDTYVRVSYEHTEYEQPFDRGTIIDNRTGKPVNTPRERRFDEAYNRTIGDSDFFTVQAQHTLSPEWKLNGVYSYNRNGYDDNQARAILLNPATGALTRRADATRGAESQQHVLQFNAQGNLKLGSQQHELVTGIDLEDSNIYRRDLIRSANRTGFNIYNPVYGQLPASTSVSAADSDQRDYLQSVSLFAMDSVRLSPHWLVQAGLRWQRYHEFAGKGRPFNTNSDIADDEFIPRLGVVWQPDTRWSFYASYSESFKPNTSIASRIDALPAETGKSWELGAKYELGQSLALTAALYDIRKRNVQVSMLQANGDTAVRAAGRARSRGFELDASGNLTRQLKLIGSYAYTDAKVTEDPDFAGKRLQNVARNTVSLFAAYEFERTAAGRWRAGGGARHVGKRAGDAANSFTLDAYTVADAFVGYDMQAAGYPLRLQFNVKNLFDKTYYASAANAQYVSIGEPRQFVLRAMLDF